MATPLPCLFGCAEMEELHPSKPPRESCSIWESDIGIGYRIPMGEVVITSPMGIRAAALPALADLGRKGSMEQSVHRPLIKSGLVA